ncbi:DUF2214 domain-containing protein [Labrys sp. LIt4]|uniref:DUF6644 family protein n=1 Tax=Labrys sp. LIt4 TaxID=2821355 RepID=UPI001ADF3D88|nr:DUF6644 family protein [Labrys sp. LIt4]MBP0581517.1 DUF2214 domain-containing protein [Labrys sp. LIt4]
MLEIFAAWPGAVLLRDTPAAYIFVNAGHILGIGLLLGAVLPLDLRLAGLWPKVPVAVIGPFLTRTAATGLGLTLVCGLWLFSVRPAHYADNAAFQAKLALLALALINIGLQHRRPAFRAALAGGPLAASVRVSALVSALLWLSVLVAGRWIGFL